MSKPRLMAAWVRRALADFIASGLPPDDTICTALTRITIAKTRPINPINQLPIRFMTALRSVDAHHVAGKTPQVRARWGLIISKLDNILLILQFITIYSITTFTISIKTRII